jgi:hypothetical protein
LVVLFPPLRTCGRNEKGFPASPPENSRVRFLESLVEAENERADEASTLTRTVSPLARPLPPER